MRTRKLWIGGVVCLILGVTWAGYHILDRHQGSGGLLTAKAERRELRSEINTNGLIEPIERIEILAPFDGFIKRVALQDGDKVSSHELLFEMESDSVALALTSARAALLQAQRQAKPVLSGPSKEEVAEIESSLLETESELQKKKEELQREEKLLTHEASTRAEVESLRAQAQKLELHRDALRQKKENLLQRYSGQKKSGKHKKLKNCAARLPC
ncbi:MAG: efflux RND transporter periplasmic adaptor subunit [Terriglobia bacterium]